jgi:hypothetical protein
MKRGAGAKTLLVVMGEKRTGGAQNTPYAVVRKACRISADDQCHLLVIAIERDRRIGEGGPTL